MVLGRVLGVEYSDPKTNHGPNASVDILGTQYGTSIGSTSLVKHRPRGRSARSEPPNQSLPVLPVYEPIYIYFLYSCIPAGYIIILNWILRILSFKNCVVHLLPY